MSLRSRRTVYYLALVVATTVLFTLVYNTGMAIWEGRPQPLYRSLEVVVQSFTTTGYGEDAPWRSPQMNLLAITMQLTGIGLILTAVDVFAVPWLRGALTPSAPASVLGMQDHVIICEHTPRTDAFITELDARDQPYVLVEADEERAGELHEAGYRVVHGDPESTDDLQAAGIGSARVVVADAADDTNASIVLSARDARPNVRVITLVEEAALARYHRAAGADEVLSPRQLLGSSLARQVPTTVTTDVAEGVTVGDDFELVEVTVAANSDLHGRTFREARLRDRFGVNVIGAWFDGDFRTPVEMGDELAARTRLLVAGESAQVEALQEATASTVRRFAPQRIVVAGYGDSGRAAADALSGSGAELTVLDVEDDDRVDVVGDARDPDVLESVGIADASALILTVADDTTAIFATLIARELNPDLYIVVRANEEDDVQKLYRAGGDYVQSLATVSGRMLASTVFEDEEVLAYDKQVNVVRLPAGDLVGSTLVDEAVRTRTGGTVVAVVREGETITDFEPGRFTFEAGDEVVVAGTDEAVTEFERTFGI
ncbi:potassium channel family protein [Haloplanus aerogenes]|uniref:Potassium transporter n=1 Tax=Haloplanus aerogenes TaxID=660522 RepID=A0A3M0DSS6_9EURY|nr:potassium channel protein [Haloplanus aerogenes]AZH24545.1 potassium transporter [Haloplanus aerogenes]RMB23800.1 Trk K+ transport system NAD-binding subunit [Haloplanus aerogenes]